MGKVWSTVHAIDGRAAPTRRQDETLRVGNRLISKDSAKADAFMKVYSKSSHLPPRVKEDRPIKHSLTDSLRSPCEQCQHQRTGCCSPFTAAELQQEISNLPAKKAAGLDQVSNEMLVRLGERGRQRLLELINLSWSRGEMPAAWKKAVITPILKRGKPPEKVESFRPISLLSCLGKLCERLVNRRLTYLLERNNLLNPCQAGFRRKRATEDQILCLTQTIADGLEGKQRTVLEPRAGRFLKGV